MYLQHNGHIALGDALLDTDLRDLDIVTMPSGTYLYSATGQNGGLVSWRLDDQGGAPVEVDRLYFPNAVAGSVNGFADSVVINGSTQLVVGDANGAALLGYQLNEDGTIAGLSETQLDLPQSTEVMAVAATEVDAGSVVYVVDGQSGQLSAYPSDGQELPDAMADGAAFSITSAGHLATIRIDGQEFLLATDLASQGVVSYHISNTSGTLTQAGAMGAGQGLGVNAPTAMEVVQAFGETWVLLGAAGSNSISVMRMNAHGNLLPADHLVDTLNTRFGGVQSLAVAQDGDRVFIIAGGADDGLSLFTLLPDGRLLHLQSLPHSAGGGLMNVGQISATVLGDEIQLFVTSGSTGGITQFSIPLSGMGEILEETGHGNAWLRGGAGHDLIVGQDGGNDTLIGEGGNDILVAGRANTVMTGGTGADRFVLRDGAFTTRITDFEPHVDQIDMSDFMMLRSTDQLTITVTAWGATIAFRDAVIEVHSASGGPLGVSALFGSGFTWPDRVLIMPDPDMELFGTTESDLLSGAAGNDTLHGEAGQDTLNGHAGNDALWGGNGMDTILGGDGNDTLMGDAEADLLLGMDGADQINGGEGDDTAYGGLGDDTLSGDGGGDAIFGNDGNDTVFGGAGNDTVGGGGGQDQVYGENGDDQVWGGDGQDALWGGRGHDTIGGGNGNDLMYGDSGRDIMWGGDGHDTLNGGGWSDELSGGGGHDLLIGHTGRDTLWGSWGKDTLEGGAENDLLGGGSQDDLLNGGSGQDTLLGSWGNDVLIGGTGDDLLSGGVGADLFVFSTDPGTDRITDFETGIDNIQITGGAAGFQGLDMAQVGSTVVITLGSGQIILENTMLSALSAGDFLFD